MLHTFVIYTLSLIELGLGLAAGTGFLFGFGMVLSLLFGPELAMPFTGYWPNLATAIALLSVTWPAMVMVDKLNRKIDHMMVDHIFKPIQLPPTQLL